MDAAAAQLAVAARSARTVKKSTSSQSQAPEIREDNSWFFVSNPVRVS